MIIASRLRSDIVSCSYSFLKDQVEHAHDNPLDEITLGEGEIKANLVMDEMPPEKPVTPKTMDLEVDQEPEVNGEEVALEEEKKTKKKDVKKDKAKSKNLLCNLMPNWAYTGRRFAAFWKASMRLFATLIYLLASLQYFFQEWKSQRRK